MRRTDREVTDFSEIVAIVEKCTTAHLGLYADDYPYVVPISYGYRAEEGSLTVYFHCAKVGRKIDLIAKDNRVALTIDIHNAYVDTGHSVTADYESVMIFGRAELCSGEEKIVGLKALMEHCWVKNYSAEECAVLPAVAVYKVVSEKISAKKRFK